ncbi:putative DNA-binding domain-containing protein [Citrobacter meridianamericanus]|uniref:HvfC/BufC family peptide modification chaperone n=1 Tax=Citrobacter meridianamericanus TaxID=2894201 RepID=UPI0039BEC813
MHQLFSDALLDPESPLPEGLMVWNGSDPTVRFGVYRNNVIASLIDALAENYPVLQAQVGEDYFRAMAAEFVRQHPPSSAVLAYYGEGLPAWIAMFPPLAGWPWLADLTALEFSFITALHTADNETDDKTFNRVVNPQVDGLLLDCSLRVMSSSYAIYQIWIAHKTGIPLANIDPFEPESVILFRQGNDMMVMPVSPAQAQFVRALLAGKTLMHSLEAGQGRDARFEPEDTLLQLHRYGLIVGLKECVC